MPIVVVVFIRLEGADEGSSELGLALPKPERCQPSVATSSRPYG